MKPKNICCTEEEWAKLTDIQKKFLEEAEAGGLRYLIDENGPYAWGPAFQGLFSMDIHFQFNLYDGYIITLK